MADDNSQFDYTGGYDPDVANGMSGFDRAMYILGHKTSIAVNTGRMSQDAADASLAKKTQALEQLYSQYGDDLFDSIKAPKSLKVKKPDFSDVQDTSSYVPEGTGLLSNLSAGFNRGMDTAARGLLMAAGGYQSLTPEGIAASALGTPNPQQDALFQAADYLKQREDTLPAPVTTGEKIAQGVGGFIPGIITGGAGQAGASGQDVIDAGGSLGQAEAAAGIDTAANLAGLGAAKLTGSLNIGSRLLAQAAAGGGAEEAARLSRNEVLDPSLRQDFDPVALGMGVGSGALGALTPEHTTNLKADKNGFLRETPKTGDPDIDAGIREADSAARANQTLFPNREAIQDNLFSQQSDLFNPDMGQPSVPAELAESRRAASSTGQNEALARSAAIANLSKNRELTPEMLSNLESTRTPEQQAQLEQNYLLDQQDRLNTLRNAATPDIVSNRGTIPEQYLGIPNTEMPEGDTNTAMYRAMVQGLADRGQLRNEPTPAQPSPEVPQVFEPSRNATVEQNQQQGELPLPQRSPDEIANTYPQPANEQGDLFAQREQVDTQKQAATQKQQASDVVSMLGDTKANLRKSIADSLLNDNALNSPEGADPYAHFWTEEDKAEAANRSPQLPSISDAPASITEAAENGQLTLGHIADAVLNNHEDKLSSEDHSWGKQVMQRLNDLPFAQQMMQDPIIRDYDLWAQKKGVDSPAVLSYFPPEVKGGKGMVLVNPFLTDISYQSLRHEMIHPIEQAYIQAGYDGNLRGPSREAFNTLHSVLIGTRDAVIKNAEARHDSNISNGMSQKQAARQFIRETYGLKNLHELSSELQTSDQFRKSLESVPMTNEQAAKLGASRGAFGRIRNAYQVIARGLNRLIGANTERADTFRDVVQGAHSDFWNKIQEEYRGKTEDPWTARRKLYGLDSTDAPAKQEERDYIPAKGTGKISRAATAVRQLAGIKSEPERVIGNSLGISAGRTHDAAIMATRLGADMHANARAEKVPMKALADFNTGRDTSALDEYPKTKAAATEYYKARQDLSRNLAGGILQNENASKKELRVANAVANNKFYQTRSYESDAASQARADLARKADERIAAGQKLTPEMEEAKQVVDDFKKYARSDILPEGLSGNEKRSNLNYRAKALGLDPAAIVNALPDGATSAEKKAAIVDALRKAVPDEATAKIALERLVDNATGKTKSPNNPLVKYSPGVKMGDILHAKKSIPPELLAMWGEKTDPIAVARDTIVKQGRELGKIEALNNIKEQGVGRFLHQGTLADAPAGYTVQLKGEKYGPLRGMFTTPETEKLLKSTVDINTAANDFNTALSKLGEEPKAIADWLSNRFGNKARWLVRTGKVFQQGSDAMFYLQNVFGGPQMAMSNAVVPFGKTAWRGFASNLVNNWPSLANSSILKDMGVSDTVKRDASLVARMGIGESSIISEHQRELEAKQIEAILRNGDYKTLTQKLAAIGKATANFAPDTMGRALGLMDGWARNAAAIRRFEFLDKMYTDQGIAPPKSDKLAYDQYERRLISEAGDRVKDTTLYSKRTSPLVQFAERHGVSRGLLFETEAWRNGVNSAYYSLIDIANGIKTGNTALATEGAKQLLGVTASLVPMHNRLSAYSLLLKGVGTAGLAMLGYQTKDVSNDDKRQGYLQQPGSWLAGQQLQEILTKDPNAKYYWSPSDINQYYYPITRATEQLTGLVSDLTSGKKVDWDREGANFAATYVDTFLRDRTMKAIYNTFAAKVPGWIEHAENTQYFNDLMTKYENAGFSKDAAKRLIVLSDFLSAGQSRAIQKANVTNATDDAKKLMSASIGVSRVRNDADLGGITGAVLNSKFSKAIQPMSEAINDPANLSNARLEDIFVKSMKAIAKQSELLGQDLDYAQATGMDRTQAGINAIEKGTNKNLVASGLAGNVTPAYVLAQSLHANATKQLAAPELNAFPSRREAMAKMYGDRFAQISKLIEKYGSMTPEQVEGL